MKDGRNQADGPGFALPCVSLAYAHTHATHFGDCCPDGADNAGPLWY